MTTESPKPRKRMGPKPWMPEPDPKILDQIEAYAARFLPEADIAYLVGTNPDTWYKRKHTIPEITERVKNGRAKVKAKLSNKIFEEAMAGNTACLIFLNKTVCGLRENDPLIHLNVDNRSVNIQDSIDPREALKRLLGGDLDHGRVLKAHLAPDGDGKKKDH